MNCLVVKSVEIKAEGSHAQRNKAGTLGKEG